MTDKEFDKIFRNKLAEHNEPVDDSVWAAIESTLVSNPVVVEPVAAETKGKKVILFWKVRKAACYVAAAAAVLLLAFFLIKPYNQSYIQPEQQVSVKEKVHSEEVGLLAHVEEPISAESGEYVGGVEPSGKNDAFNENVPENVPHSSRDHASEADKAVELTVETERNDGVNEQSLFCGTELDYQYESHNKLNKKEYSLSLFSNLMSSSGLEGSPRAMGSAMGAAGVSDMQSTEVISDAKYSLPVNVGIQAQVRLNSYLSFGVGVGYTWLNSRYDALINKKFYRVKQNLHYINVPVNIYFTIVDKDNLCFYANAGASVEKGVRASYKFTSYDGTSYSSNAEIDGFQYSANAGFGVEYRFSKLFGLYLEPNVIYYFNSNVPGSIRTDQPLQFKAEVGFRFHIQ